MFESRIRQLERLYQNLNHQIDVLETSGKFDNIELTELKKQRLSITDQLRDLRRRQWDHDQEVGYE